MRESTERNLHHQSSADRPRRLEAQATYRNAGAVVKTDEGSMKAVYDPDVTERAALTGKVPVPPEAHAFLAAIRGARAQASAAKQ